MNDSDSDPARKSQDQLRDALARSKQDRQRMLRETREELGGLLNRPKKIERPEVPDAAPKTDDEQAPAPDSPTDDGVVESPAPKKIKAMKPMDSSAPTRPIKTGAIIAALIVAAAIVIAVMLLINP